MASEAQIQNRKARVGEAAGGRWEMGDGRWELGDGSWEMGDSAWQMAHRDCESFQLLTSIYHLPALVGLRDRTRHWKPRKTRNTRKWMKRHAPLFPVLRAFFGSFALARSGLEQ